VNELFRALPALLSQFEDNEILREAVVFAAWRKAAGESLRRHAVPVRLYEKQLIVAVGSDTWKKHLTELSGQMIFRINSVLGRALVTFIEYRVDERTVRDARGTDAAEERSEAELIEDALCEVNPKMREAAAAIKDENLRLQFLLAAGSCLSRRNRIEDR
jgi:hypothetical protein